MRNRAGLILTLPILLAVGLGCSMVTDLIPGSNSSTPDTSSNPVTNPETMLREKTGVPECDALLDFFADQAKTQSDNYVERAAKEFFFNKIRQSIKENIEQNKNNPKEMAKNCSEFKKQLEIQLQQEKDANK